VYSRRKAPMLTLTRKVGESIRIGDNIEIVVKEIRRNHIRIGISAPKDVKIFREELYLNIQKGDSEE
jgi:carbon storage regulator